MKQFLGLLIMLIILNHCTSNKLNDIKVKNKADSTVTEKIKSDSIIEGSNISWLQRTKEANKKFKISDSLAMKLVLQIREFKNIINITYSDSLTKRHIFVGNIPTDINPVWIVQVMEITHGADFGHNLLFISVNANDGKIISIMDNALDPAISFSFNEWKRERRKLKTQ